MIRSHGEIEMLAHLVTYDKKIVNYKMKQSQKPKIGISTVR